MKTRKGIARATLRMSAPLLAAVVALVSSGIASPAPPPVSRLAGEKMSLEVTNDPFALRVLDPRGHVLLETDGPLAFTTVANQRISRLVLWWKWTRGISQPWTKVDQVVAVRLSGERLELDLGQKAEGPVLVRMRARFLDSRALKVETEVVDRPDVNRIQARFKKDQEDRYYGMGERYDSAEQTGKVLRVWCEEGGLGLGGLSRVWPRAPFNPFPNGPDMTYFPVPFYLNPAKGYGFLLDDNHFSRFDFGKSRPRSLLIENWNHRFDFLVFYGPGPLQVIEAQTAYTGRITLPPPWVFAPMNAAVESEERVREVAALARREKIPTTAIWSEDWWWRTEWVVNQERYPNYAGMIKDLHAEGFRHLGYFQPYLTVGVEAYKEGEAKGYLTRDREGQVYDFGTGLWKKAQLDLANPAADEWWKTSFFAMAEGLGVDGWMHDFGEHTPPDSAAFDGRTGWDLHNEYPLLWAKLGREFWDQARPDGDYCFYIRGGYTGVQKYASVMWTGDQNANFEKLDGLPCNIPALASVGISGHPIGTTDIAGYNCYVNKPTDQELFMRWTELGALLPVMRIHRGDVEHCDMWSFDQNRETLDHYKKYAVLHTALFPYLYTLADEAARTGWPVVRHLMLHYPEDREACKQDYEYLLGDRALVAPVIERGARERKVYFPEGEWAHWWTGKIYRGPGFAVVPADLGAVPMFVRTGKVLPLFDRQIDTLVKENRPDLNGFDDANASLQIVFFGAGQDDYTLWDGTRILCQKTEGAAGSCAIEKAPRERKYAFDFK